MQKILGIIGFLFGFQSLLAIPMDINGSFYVDSTYISGYRGTKSNLGTSGNSSWEIPKGDRESALFQNYIFRLNPSLIINDNVTVKGELSHGGIRGGFLGDSGKIYSDNQAAQSLYSNTTNGSKAISFNQVYAEIYSETALFKIGRFAKHWGLGLALNDGRNYDDRFFSLLEGAQAEFSFQKFSFTPYWARISSGDKHITSDDVREMGISAMYKDKDQNFEVGLHLSQRTGHSQANYYNQISTKIKLYDLYFKRSWKDLILEVEVPFISGNYGAKDIKSFAGVAQAHYNLERNWSLSTTFAYVGGQDESNDITVMGLHPNFQIAHLLFRYNFLGIEDSSVNLYSSQITNALVAKIAGKYTRGNWSMEMAFIFGKANEVAKVGKNSYNERTGQFFTGNAKQKSDLGYELDFTTEYLWYPNVKVVAKLGYLFLGDYYSFTNTGTSLDLKNPWTASIGLGITF